MSAPKSTEWLNGDIERLRRLWAEGVSAREIAAVLHRTRNGVISKVRRMGLDFRRPTRTRTPRVLRQSHGRRAAEIMAPILPSQPDTRTRHQRWMGDPPPGRSALDQRERTKNSLSYEKLQVLLVPANRGLFMEDRDPLGEAI